MGKVRSIMVNPHSSHGFRPGFRRHSLPWSPRSHPRQDPAPGHAAPRAARLAEVESGGTAAAQGGWGDIRSLADFHGDLVGFNGI